MSNNSDSPVPGAGQVDPDIVAPAPDVNVGPDDQGDDHPDYGDDAARSASCPITVLGSYLGVCYFLTPRGEFEAIGAKQITSTALRGLFRGCEWWLYQEFPRTKTEKDASGNETEVVVGWRWEAVTWWLLRQAEQKPMFDPGGDVLRGCGVWRDDDGDLIVHSGGVIHHKAQRMSPGVEIDGRIYLGQPPRTPPAFDDVASASMAAEFDTFICRRWGWENEFHARLFTGWVICSVLSGALRWRPHIHVGGAFGIGKSTLLDAARSIIGREGLLEGSDPTGAAIARMVGLTAGAFLLDEVEPDEDGRRWESVVETVRLASAERQAPRVRAGMSGPGDVATYRLRSCFIIAGTLRPEPRPADMSRISFLLLSKSPPDFPGQPISEALAHWSKLGPRLRARVINCWPRFVEERERVIDYLGQQSQTRRFAEQYGTLLAAREVFVSDEPIEMAAMDGLIAELLMHFPDETRPEHEQCLDHFLTRAQPHWKSGEQLTVLKLIGQATTGEGDVVHYHNILKSHGVRLDPSPGAGGNPTAVWISPRHASIKATFEGTRWANGAWKQLFESFAGAEKLGVKKFSGFTDRPIALPFALCWSADGDENG